MKLTPKLNEHRDEIFLGCKTQERTYYGAWGELHKSLERLDIDYIDLYQFHALTRYDELDTVTGDYHPEMSQGNHDPGALEAFKEAKEDAVVIHMDGTKRMFISGVVAEGEDIETQTRNELEQIEAMLADHDGGMEDIVRVRVYISRPKMDEDSLETVHDVRSEFFSQDHLPASTLIEVEDLVSDEFLIEIDADAIIPDDGWDVE